MAKQKKAVEKKVEAPKVGRQGYKRKSNGRIDQAGDALKARVVRALKADAYASKAISVNAKTDRRLETLVKLPSDSFVG
ncbi:hypothetical protein UGMREWDR_CDS0009 [Aeromonas phage GomatiRiver_11]|nr:hypothetical protein OBDJBBDK_00009 [Aeromonas phage AhFM11]WKW84176.1 hypothetical protein UGMREWDR_CDS0009 [Aeromonas phage GomatiRiver_11]